MSTDLQTALRRLKVNKRLDPITKRAVSDLPFWSPNEPLIGKILLDTTVYVDILQRKFPQSADIFLRAAERLPLDSH